MPNMSRQSIDVPGYPAYAITRNGVVYVKHTGRIMSQFNNHSGYKFVGLTNENGRKHLKIHRLVMMAFRPVEGMDKLQVNHKDGNKANNSLDNLEWCTGLENIRHARKTGLKTYDQHGEKNNFHKLTEENVQFILANLNRYTDRELAEMFNVTVSNINYIRNGKTWNSLHRKEGDI